LNYLPTYPLTYPPTYLPPSLPISPTYLSPLLTSPPCSPQLTRPSPGGGLWQPDATQLSALRREINRKPHKLKRVLGRAGIRGTFLGGVSDDEDKVVAAFVAARNNASTALKRNPKVCLCVCVCVCWFFLLSLGACAGARHCCGAFLAWSLSGRGLGVWRGELVGRWFYFLLLAACSAVFFFFGGPRGTRFAGRSCTGTLGTSTI
jgi:hypothetical protein